MKKKIIFYNTTIATLLEYKEKYLIKIKHVFDFFKKSEKLVLLWRPHPLLETTLGSMCPELLEEYKRLVEYYKKENIGIFDDTSDMYRAIGLADAYYGDGSSVIELFRMRNKPIMIQNVAELYDDKMISLPAIEIRTMIKQKNGKLFWMSMCGNDICFCSGGNFQVKGNYDVKPNEMYRYAFAIEGNDGKIIFSTRTTGEVYSYCSVTNACRRIEIEGGSCDEQYSFANYKNQTYVIGGQTKKVYKYDAGTYSMKLQLDSSVKGKKLVAEKRCKNCRYSLFFETDSSCIYIYDCIQGRWEECNSPGGYVKNGLYCADKLWIVSSDNRVYISQDDFSNWKEINVSVRGDIKNIVESKDEVILFMERSNCCIHINKHSYYETVCELDFLEKGLKHQIVEVGDDTVLIACREDYGKCWTAEREDKYYLYNVEKQEYVPLIYTFETKEKQEKFVGSCMEMLYSSIQNNQGYFVENQIHGLVEFGTWLPTREDKAENINKISVGEIIHSSIINRNNI